MKRRRWGEDVEFTMKNTNMPWLKLFAQVFYLYRCVFDTINSTCKFTSWRFQRWRWIWGMYHLWGQQMSCCFVSRKSRTKNPFLPGRVRHPFMIPPFWDLPTSNQSLFSFVHWILPPNSAFLRDLHIPFPPPLLTSPFLGNPSRVSHHLRLVPWSWPCSARCASWDLRSWCPSDFSHATRSPMASGSGGRWCQGSGANEEYLPKQRKGEKGWKVGETIDGNSGVLLCDWKNWCYTVKNMVHTSFRSRCLWTDLWSIRSTVTYPWCPIIMKVKIWIKNDDLGRYRDPELRNTPNNIQLVHNRFFTDHLRLHSFPGNIQLASSPDPNNSLRKCPNECGWSKDLKRLWKTHIL